MKGNHKNPQPVTPVYNRKIARHQLKNMQGSNKISKAWERIQIGKYGFKQYIAMRLSKVAKGKGRELLNNLYNG